MFWWIILAVFLYFLCAALLVAEVFVPSFGLLSLLALSSLTGGVIIFFNYSHVAGWAGIFIAVIMIPTVLVGAYKIFPKTGFGRNVSLFKPEIQPGQAIPDSDVLSELGGKSGIAVTDLRPVGMCEIDGQRLECVAESGYIDSGIEVEVIKVESTQVTVRKKENN